MAVIYCPWDSTKDMNPELKKKIEEIFPKTNLIMTEEKYQVRLFSEVKKFFESKLWNEIEGDILEIRRKASRNCEVSSPDSVQRHQGGIDYLDQILRIKGKIIDKYKGSPKTIEKEEE